MRELFKNAFKITNNNIILTIPLIIYVKIFELYSVYSRLHANSMPKLVIASVTVLFMFGVFCAGWFYMVKQAIELSKRFFVNDAQRANASLSLFKTLPEGIGLYSISFAWVYVIFFIMQILITPLIYLIGVKLFGALDEASIQSLQNTLSTNTSAAAFAESLTPEQITFFGKWSILFMAATTLIMYLLMLWVPEILYKTPDAFSALYKSVIKLFKDFKSTLKLFISIWLIGFALLFLNTFAAVNNYAYLFMCLIMYYFTVYFAVIIFLYYDRKYVDEH